MNKFFRVFLYIITSLLVFFTNKLYLCAVIVPKAIKKAL